MAVRISRGLLEAILADARLTPGLERCGLLLGCGEVISGWQAAANVHPEPERHFELDPAVLIAAERAARTGADEAQRANGAMAVIGHYHSHPVGPAVPSEADAEAAMPDGRLWLIINRDNHGLWRSDAMGPLHGRFSPVNLVLLD